MDRTRSSPSAGFAAVRFAPGGSIKCVLHAEHQRVAGEPGADAPHRPAVLEDAILRLAAHDVVAQHARALRQPQTCREADAGDGITGGRTGSAHEQTTPGARQTPVFTAWNGDRRAVPGVERGHHLHPDAARLHVPRGRHRLVQPLRARLGRVQQHGERLLRGNVDARLEKGPSGHFQHGPGQPVYECGVHRHLAEGRCAHQYGRTRPGARQRVHRTAVAQREIRGHLPARLSRRLRPARGTGALFSLLQSPASAQRTWQLHPGKLPQKSVTPGDFRARFGAVPLRPCPTGSPPAGGHGLRSTAPKRTPPAHALTPEDGACYSDAGSRRKPAVLRHLNSPR